MTKLGAAASNTEITTILSNEGLQLQFVTGSATNIVFPQEIIGIYGQDEAVGLGTGTILNVVGTDITLSLSGNVLQLLHTNPTITFPAAIIGLYGQDEGGNLGTGTVLNVVGPNIALSLSGTVLQLLHADPTPITAQEEGVLLGTGTVFNFRGSNTTATISGTVVDVYCQTVAGNGLEASGTSIGYRDIGTSLYNSTNLVSTGTAAAAWRILTFDRELYDNGNIHSLTGTGLTSRIIASIPGTYLLGVHAEWEANVRNQRSVQIRKNSAGLVTSGVPVVQNGGVAFTTGSTASSMETTMPVQLSINDYVEAFVLQNSGSNLNILSGTTRFWAQKIG